MDPNKVRFSKEALSLALCCDIDRLTKKFNLDLTNGTAQLPTGDTDRAVAYGAARALEELLSDLDSGGWSDRLQGVS